MTMKTKMMIICKSPVNMEYDDGRDKRDSGDGIERESHMFKVDCVISLVAWAERFY